MASGSGTGWLFIQALVVLSLLLFKPCAAVVAVGTAFYNTLSILFQNFMLAEYGDIRKKYRGCEDYGRDEHYLLHLDSPLSF